MFESESKNRRMTPKEAAEEKIEAALWGRPERQFIKDHPSHYYGVPLEPLVNFSLNYQ